MKDKINKIIHSRVFTFFLIALVLVTVAITGTYAWFTWSSTENTTLTMSIGKLADVVFNNGNNIVTNELAPVFNYEDGEKTNFEIINRDTTGAMLLYKVKLNIVNIPTELKNKSFKYALVGNSASNKELINSGSFESYQDGDSIILYEDELPSGTTWHGLYIYIDGNEENSLSMMNLNFSGNIEVTVEEKMDPTPLSDFDYYLGSESTTIDSLDYYYPADDSIYNLSIAPITISSNEILLTKYNGTDPNVVVPSTYIVDDITYNTVILSSTEIYLWDENLEIDVEDFVGIFVHNDLINTVFIADNVKSISDEGENSFARLFKDCVSFKGVNNLPKNIVSMYMIFSGCTSLETAPEIPSSVTNMSYTFNNCTSLTTAPEIPSSVTNMSGTFKGCTSLETAPEIPSSVTNMSGTFEGCTSLTTAPEIPSSVTNMGSTFKGCTSLETAPEIPSSVTFIGYAFMDCTSLTMAPEIPSSVTGMPGAFQRCTGLITAPIIPRLVGDMWRAFYGCTSLTGTVEIKSTNVSNVNYIFGGTSKPITVYVPSGSTTYTNLNSLTTTNGMPANVTLQGR